MAKQAWKRAIDLVRALPPQVILKAANLCNGHSILNPQAFTEAGLPKELVEHLTSTYRSNGSSKGTLFVAGKPVPQLSGVYGLNALRLFASALGVQYTPAFGRGTEARNIRSALQQHLGCRTQE